MASILSVPRRTTSFSQMKRTNSFAISTRVVESPHDDDGKFPVWISQIRQRRPSSCELMATSSDASESCSPKSSIDCHVNDSCTRTEMLLCTSPLSKNTEPRVAW